MYIGIKEGKVFDLVSDLKNKRDMTLEDSRYIEMKLGDVFIGDTWDFKENTNLKDSSIRFIEPEPTELDLMKVKINELETRIIELESKITKEVVSP